MLFLWVFLRGEGHINGFVYVLKISVEVYFTYFNSKAYLQIWKLMYGEVQYLIEYLGMNIVIVNEKTNKLSNNSI